MPMSERTRRLVSRLGPAAKVAGVVAIGLPVPDADDPESSRAARGRLLLRLVGWLVAVFVVIGTFFTGRPPSPASVVLTVLALGLWSASTFMREARIIGAFLLAAGLLGAGLNLLNPSGPGYIVVFLVIASIAARFRLGVSLLLNGVIAVASVASEVVTARNPVSAGMNILIGLLFVFAAASFARASHVAHQRAAALLVQEEAARAAKEEAAVLGERTRLARELHDVLAHSLSGLSIQLAGAALLAEKTSADQRLIEQIKLSQSSAHEGMANAKRAVETLHGEGLPGPKDVPALLDRTRQTTGFDITYVVEGEVRPLSPETGLAIYRTVQESLTNVARHAGRGAAVTVTLRWTTDDVSVAVVDRGGDGRSAGLPSGGHGLRGLRERSAQLGGQVEAGPVEDGWRVLLTMPFQPLADSP